MATLLRDGFNATMTPIFETRGTTEDMKVKLRLFRDVVAHAFYDVALLKFVDAHAHLFIGTFDVDGNPIDDAAPLVGAARLSALRKLTREQLFSSGIVSLQGESLLRAVTAALLDMSEPAEKTVDGAAAAVAEAPRYVSQPWGKEAWATFNMEKESWMTSHLSDRRSAVKAQAPANKRERPWLHEAEADGEEGGEGERARKKAKLAAPGQSVALTGDATKWVLGAAAASKLDDED